MTDTHEKLPTPKPPRDERNVAHYINMEDAEKMLVYAAWAVEKWVAPKKMTREEYFMILQAGTDLKMSLMQVNSSLCIVNGRVSIYGPEVIARARRAGYIITPLEESVTAAKVQIEIEGRKPYVAEFLASDADTAGLTTGDRAAIWKKYPKDMLFWKAAARAVRKYAPEVLGGYDVAEDVAELKAPDNGRTISKPDLSRLEIWPKPVLLWHEPEKIIGQVPDEVQVTDSAIIPWYMVTVDPALPDGKMVVTNKDGEILADVKNIDTVPEVKIQWEQAELPT